MSKRTRKQMKQLKAQINSCGEKSRKKGHPIFGNTPYGSKGGPANTSGFRAPSRRWDRLDDEEGVEV